MLTHEHVQHLARRNDSLSTKVEKLKHRAAKLTGHGVQLLEISAGAAISGVLQGMAKGPDGPHLLKVPTDLGIGVALNLAAALDLAGAEWSQHLANVGTGFIAAYVSDRGHSIGERKKVTGSFFGAKAALPALPGATVHGQVDPATMAALLMRQHQGG